MNSPNLTVKAEQDTFRRILMWLLTALALLYAGFAGLRTVGDFDAGWQLATGRWVAQHHAIFSQDVFSYTAAGHAWVYPPFSGLFLYLVYIAGGFGALSWLGAIACIATVVFGLRRDSPLAIALAILAVPSIAFRTVPRADLFTTVLFALTLRLLWRYRETGKGPLWVLPAIFLVWTNLHLGFVSGLGVLIAYTGAEITDSLFPARRALSVRRLLRASGWMLAAAVATLVNQWGWNIYRALNPLHANQQAYDYLVTEWSAVRLTPAVLLQAVAFRDPNCQFWWMVVCAVVLVVVALRRMKFGEAIFLAGGIYLSLQHVRLQAVFVIVVMIIGGSVVASRKDPADAASDSRLPQIALWASVVLALVLVPLRVVDLVTNRSYLANGEISLFGAGRSWWFPERAAQFIETNHLPTNLMGTYNLGGFLLWRLPQYPDYVDGRAFPFGPELIRRQGELQAQALDSPDWQSEADRWKINTVIFSTARFAGLNFPIQPNCASEKWKPVYLDDVAMVFVRNTPENQALVQKFAFDCQRVQLQPPLEARRASLRGRAELYNFEANAGAIYYLLSRDTEAMAAYQVADSIFDDDGNLHFSIGQYYQARNQLIVAEGEYRLSIRQRPTELAYYALARLLAAQNRYEEAAVAVEKSSQLAMHPASRYKTLGQVDLKINRFAEALQWLDKAMKTADAEERSPEFLAQISESRAAALRQLGDLNAAVGQQKLAVEATPKNAARWQSLADLYQAQGDYQKATAAAVEANAIRGTLAPE